MAVHQKTSSRYLTTLMLAVFGLVLAGGADNSDVVQVPVNKGLSDAEKTYLPEAYPVKWNINVVDASLPQGHPTKSESLTPPVPRVPAHGHHGLHVQHGMLFLRKTLYPGATLPQGTKLAANGLLRPREFISKVESDVVPFGYSHLDEILALFNITPGSRMAEQVSSTLRTCEASFSDPHTCATSAQAAADFAADTIGTSHLRRAVSVIHGSEPSRYIVAENGITHLGVPGATLVPCHPMPYPYLVRFCHKPEDVEALSVELIGEGGAVGAATAVAVCHSNTWSWDNQYFVMLNATRGEEICHFMPEYYLLWMSGDAQ